MSSTVREGISISKFGAWVELPDQWDHPSEPFFLTVMRRVPAVSSYLKSNLSLRSS
jgi:hypothetical protein